MEFLVLFYNFLADKLQQGLIGVVFHTDKLAEYGQIKSISLSFICASVENVSNT